ncbi:MAG TPA: DUF1822 family protein, partial [Candidatus Obscuribacterales bacterium]
MTRTDVVGMPVSLDASAHDQAARLAAEQVSPAVGRRVYLNALAVWAVHTYCGWLGVASEVDQGDGWQPGLAAVLDVADLEITGVGRLECRPVLPGATSFTVPLEAMCDRIGYVAVQFNDQLDSVELLGFLPPFAPDQRLEPPTVALSELQSMDALVNAIYAVPVLREWLEGLFHQPDWQAPERLLATRHRPTVALPVASLAVTSEEAATPVVSQAKRLTLGKSSGQSIILVVQVAAPQAGDSLTVRLRLYPASSRSPLPRQLSMVV